MAACPAARTDRPPLDLQTLLRRYGSQLGPLPPWKARVCEAIATCRTAAQGGHRERCGDCGYERVVFHSCSNRHCPRCQGLEQARWAEQRTSELLPVPYHHVVFTVPHELQPLLLSTPTTTYGLLFRAAADTLLEVAATPQNLGARIGFLCVLHTWTQKLDYHPHLHCIVPGGGISPDGTRWIHAHPRFLLNVRALSEVFRAKLLASLRRALERGDLLFAPADARRRCRKAFRHRWAVHSKPPFAGPEHVVRYLSRYTHRTAISDSRLLRLDGDRVVFRWRDRSDGDREKVTSLDAVTFLRRFLLHVLPKGFVRIRSYGFLANCVKNKSLTLCRSLLDAPPPPAGHAQQPWDVLLELLTGEDPLRCPVCGKARLARIADVAPIPAPPCVARARSP